MRKISVGTSQVCARVGTSPPKLHCFGDNASGALGIGTGDKLIPASDYPSLPNGGAVELGDFDGTPGPDRAKRVCRGFLFGCAPMEDDTLRCWGDNRYGHLGYGPSVVSVGVGETPAASYAKLGHADVQF